MISPQIMTSLVAELGNSWAISGMSSVFVNKVSLEHNHTHFPYCLQLLFCNNDRAVWLWQRFKIFIFWSFTVKLYWPLVECTKFCSSYLKEVTHLKILAHTSRTAWVCSLVSKGQTTHLKVVSYFWAKKWFVYAFSKHL